MSSSSAFGGDEACAAPAGKPSNRDYQMKERVNEVALS
jgi:hypothetical protein